MCLDIEPARAQAILMRGMYKYGAMEYVRKL